MNPIDLHGLTNPRRKDNVLDPRPILTPRHRHMEGVVHMQQMKTVIPEDDAVPEVLSSEAVPGVGPQR